MKISLKFNTRKGFLSNYNTVNSYRLFNEKNEDLKVNTDTNCLRTITYGKIPVDTRYIRFTVKKTEIPVEDSLVYQYIQDVNEMGFPCSVEENEKGFVFIFDLSLYTNRLHLFSGMFIVRYLWHYDINNIINAYFLIMEEIPTADKFYAIQLAHIFLDTNFYDGQINVYGVNTNHTIRDTQYRGFLSKKEFDKKCSQSPNLLSGSTSITISWLKDMLSPIPESITEAYITAGGTICTNTDKNNKDTAPLNKADGVLLCQLLPTLTEESPKKEKKPQKRKIPKFYQPKLCAEKM